MVKRTIALFSAIAAILFLTSIPAYAATTISGPINLGTAANYGALAGSTVTNVPALGTTITGLVGVFPGTEITGFPPGISTGEQAGTTVEQGAKADLTTAYNVAASLTPTSAGLGDLINYDPVPGVYQGTVLSLTGPLLLTGGPDSVWVFQADQELNIGSAAQITFAGGASSCNVFWKVGSSATIDTGADFAGTVMADQSISAANGATIQGRLLARIAAVTLDNNQVTLPTGCGASGTYASSPVVTSGTPTSASRGVPYQFSITSSATPTSVVHTIDSGSLPAGLSLNASTGLIEGTPTTLGTSSFVLRVSNGVAPDALVAYVLAVSPAALAETGVFDSMIMIGSAGALLLVGAVLMLRGRRKLGNR